MDEVIEHVESLGGVLTLRPQPGDGFPEIAWGDAFLYYAPDGVVPRTQPFATVVTKDHPGDEASRLDRPGVFRVNVAAGRGEFRRWTGADPPGGGTLRRRPEHSGRRDRPPRLRPPRLAGGRRPRSADRDRAARPAPDGPLPGPRPRRAPRRGDPDLIRRSSD